MQTVSALTAKITWENNHQVEPKDDAEIKQISKKQKMERIEEEMMQTAAVSSTRVMCPVEGCGGGWTQGNKWKHETTAKHVSAQRSCMIRNQKPATSSESVVEQSADAAVTVSEAITAVKSSECTLGPRLSENERDERGSPKVDPGSGVSTETLPTTQSSVQGNR